jgi:hypothetical protein
MVFRTQTTRCKTAKLADCHQLAATRLILAARLRFFARHSRVIPRCALSASTNAGFRLDPIPQS